MALYYSVGGNLLRPQEVRRHRETILSFANEKVSVKSGGLTFAAESHGFEFAPSGEAPTVAFTPIGLGKPLTIWLASVYPGDLPPKSGIFGKERGALVTSAVKSWQTFDAQPRALNMLKKSVTRLMPISGPAATEEGTRVMFYSPALVDRSLTLTVELAIDNINEELFNSVGGIFRDAAGLPIFAMASPYLLAAGSLFKLGGQVANGLYDNKAEFQGTEVISFDVGGERTAVAGFAVLTRSELDESTLKNYSIGKDGILRNAEGTAYQGKIPYAVIALDGREDKRLEEFKSTAASAALMQRFYNVRTDGQTNATALIEALSLYNDFRFRSEADDILKELQKPGLSEDEKKALTEKLDAIKKNIKNELFKPE
ncbi:hypothetical protein [Tahibacter caeni]|uniref:hypothetical protein n=1 Tax=Tahibacter caeni TaxID=1453545 RepID=UPI002147260E|nr:hypothetical protein [Tahibacter caeni]